MKRTIIRYATLLALLGILPTATCTADARTSRSAALPELAADSLQRLCGGRLPVYAADGQLWMEIPEREIHLTVQVDRGAGMRNRPLRSLPTFRLAADPQTGSVRMVRDDSLTKDGLGERALPLARLAGTQRLLAGIDRGLYESGVWYDCSGGILRQRRQGHERLLGIDPTTDGCLVRIEVWYDVESPDRGTEIQMQSGALPLEIEIRLATVESTTALPRELVLASNLPAADVRALNEAVGIHNRTHRNAPLKTVAGNEILPLTTPYGISFDAAAERISTWIRRQEGTGTDFVRINLGSAVWERVALIHALDDNGSYSKLRRNLSDPALRRHACLRDSLVSALNRAFDPASAEASKPQSEKTLVRELRHADRLFARWNRFMQKDADRLSTPEPEEQLEAIYRAMLDRSQRLYVQFARQSRGTLLESEILEWIARGLIADGQGRFAARLLRENSLTFTPHEMARRHAAVWERVLEETAAESLATIPELFNRMLSEADHATLRMQDAFVGALLKQLPDHPQYLPVAEALEALYDRATTASDVETALFARIEQQRLAKTDTRKR